MSRLAQVAKPTSASTESEYILKYKSCLKGCQQELTKLINEANCGPILIRLAWHDSGTFDRTIKRWPDCGGANGSIRFEKELLHGANAGLEKAIEYLKPIKEQYSEVSWADLIQLASVTAIAYSGLTIPIRFGRIDTKTEAECPPEGNLPAANPPFPDNSPDAATHLRRIFYRMGFDDCEIVALSGAHTMGRAFKERSGVVQEGSGNPTCFTCEPHVPRADGRPGLGMPGGRSWTKHWLTFDNEYFTETDRELLVQLSTDKVLFVDQYFKESTDLYAKDQSAFFRDYTEAHRKLSELGSKFYPSQGFYL